MSVAESILDPSVRSNFASFTQDFEGLLTWMYLDVKGLVTTGYGFLIDPTIDPRLDFRDLAGLPVDHTRLMAEWQKVKALQPIRAYGGGTFRQHTDFRATLASINTVLYDRLDENVAALSAYFPRFAEFPATAQLGIVSMAWAVGRHFPQTFPHFTAAANASDWTIAAQQCRIDETDNPGVHRRNVANCALFNDAACGRALKV